VFPFRATLKPSTSSMNKSSFRFQLKMTITIRLNNIVCLS
jgi:hypothetical protein